MKFKVLEAKRLNNSRNGNPRYKFKLLSQDNGFEFVAKTRADAGWVYGIGSLFSLEGKEVEIEYKKLKKGYVLDNLVEVA